MRIRLFVEPPPNQEKRAGKVRGLLRDPDVQFFLADPAPGVDFVRVQVEGSVRAALEYVYELTVRFGARRELEQKLGRTRKEEPDFLVEFADGGGGVRFAGVQVTRRGRIPEPGLAVLGFGAFLEEDLSGLVEHEDVDGAVEQTEPMHLVSGPSANDLVPLVHHIEDFVRVRTRFRGLHSVAA